MVRAMRFTIDKVDKLTYPSYEEFDPFETHFAHPKETELNQKIEKASQKWSTAKSELTGGLRVVTSYPDTENKTSLLPAPQSIKDLMVCADSCHYPNYCYILTYNLNSSKASWSGMPGIISHKSMPSAPLSHHTYSHTPISSLARELQGMRDSCEIYTASTLLTTFLRLVTV